MIENEELTLSLPEKYRAWLEDAIANAHIDGLMVETGELRVPEWPMLAAILTSYQSDPDGMRAALYAAGGTECSIEKASDDSVVAVVTSRPLGATELFPKLAGPDTPRPMSMLLAYGYLSTVFDDSVHGKEGISAPDLDALVFPI